MGLLGKKGIDTIDYTLLQKKGFIKKSEEKASSFKFDSQGVVDFTSSNLNESVQSPNVSQSSPNGSPFEFLDNFAQASSQNVSGNLINENPEISSMKIKVEDIEYKLTNLVEKLALIEAKLDSFERKVLS